MYTSFSVDAINVIRSTNETAPFSDSTTWDLYAALIATIINLEAIRKYGVESSFEDPRCMIVFRSRDNAFVGQIQSKLIIFFGSDYGTLTADYDFLHNTGGYSYSSSTYLSIDSFDEFMNSVDRYIPVNPDNFIEGFKAFMSMIAT